MFGKGDRVKVNEAENIFYGKVISLDLALQYVTVLLTNGNQTGSSLTFDIKDVEQIRDFESVADVLKALCRYEITFEDEACKYIPNECERPLYQIGIFDLHCAIRNCRDSGVLLEKFENDWFFMLQEKYGSFIGLNRVTSAEPRTLEYADSTFCHEWNQVADMFDRGICATDVSELLGKYSETEKKWLETVAYRINHNNASEKMKHEFENILNEITNQKEQEAEAHNETHKGWKDEYNKLMKLYLQSGDAVYAVELGKLFCMFDKDSGYIPDYDSANKYFSIAADHGLAGGYLWKSKLADKGNGGYVRDHEFAKYLADVAYELALDEVLCGKTGMTFPEVAMWCAQLIQDELGMKAKAISYYLEASSMLKKITCGAISEYQPILNNIELCVMNQYRQMINDGANSFSFDLAHALFPRRHDNGHFILNVTKASVGGYYLAISHADEQPHYVRQKFIIAPDIWNQDCYLLKKLVVKVPEMTQNVSTPLDQDIIFDSFLGNTFWQNSREVASFEGNVALVTDKCIMTEDNEW